MAEAKSVRPPHCLWAILALAILLGVNILSVWRDYDVVERNLQHAKQYQYEQREAFWNGEKKIFSSHSLTHWLVSLIRN